MSKPYCKTCGDYLSQIELVEGSCANCKAVYVDFNLCPICGEKIQITGETKDGRIIGSCKDAFTMEQFIKD